MSLLVVVVVFGAAVWSIARVAPLADLDVLPRSRRHRVEWCRRHAVSVPAACALLTIGVLVVDLAT